MNTNENAHSDKPVINLADVAVAYLRPVTTSQGKGFAVCTADGSQLAVFPTRDAAYFAAKQHDLEPLNLH